MRLFLSLLIALPLYAAPKQLSTLEFDVAGMTCGGCVATVTTALEKVPGVTKVSIDFETTRARVEASRAVAPAEIRKALAKFGFEARFAGDAVVKPLSADERKLVDVKALPAAKAIDVRKDLAPGKITIVDFWAAWCGPCHVLSPKLERLVQGDPSLALRTVDVSEWDSPLGKQLSTEFRAAALPYVRVYGPNGKLLGAVVGNDIEQVRRLVAQGKR